MKFLVDLSEQNPNIRMASLAQCRHELLIEQSKSGSRIGSSFENLGTKKDSKRDRLGRGLDVVFPVLCGPSAGGQKSCGPGMSPSDIFVSPRGVKADAVGPNGTSLGPCWDPVFSMLVGRSAGGQ